MNLQDLEILYESLKSKQSSSQTRYISYHSLYKTGKDSGQGIDKNRKKCRLRG